MGEVQETGNITSLTPDLVTTPRYSVCENTLHVQLMVVSPQLVRAVNEVYHTYNRQQYPCVVLNIATARGNTYLKLDLQLRILT